MSVQRLPRVAVLGVLAAAAGWLVFGGRPEAVGQFPAAPAAPVAADAKDKGKDDRAADRAALEKAIGAFEEAFKKNDAKAVAALWTPDGEYVSDDGTTFSGRAALEKAYTEFFAKNPDNALDVEIASVKFPSRDTAVVEGHFKLRKGKTRELVVSKCSFLYAREDGKWLVAIAREQPGDGLSLRDLEWLIGTWEAKRDGNGVSTKYEWTANKAFIRAHFTLTMDGKTFSGTQMIGKDPATGLLHIWTFEDSGGIGNTDISRDGKKFVQTAHAVTADGRVVTTTNIMTPLDADSFLWHSVERSIDGEDLPDLPPIKVVRAKAK